MAITGRATISGVLGTAETFSYSCGWQFDGAGTAAEGLVIANSWAVNMLTAGFRSVFSTEVHWTKVKWASIDLSTGDITETAEQSLTIDGTGSTTTMPYEVAICVSLRTATAGPRGRGRMFLPCPWVSIAAGGGVFNTSQIGTIVTGLASAFDLIASSSSRPVVLSQSLLGPGLVARPIIRFDVGNVPDVQRRRRRSLVEARQSSTINYA